MNVQGVGGLYGWILGLQSLAVPCENQGLCRILSFLPLTSGFGSRISG
jgi:hypothetical protein